MKKNFLYIFCAILLVSCSASEGESKTEKFNVYGNCTMCEKTIEGSLEGVEGVTEADWVVESNEMSVSFDPEVITFDEIKQKIADVGYDSDSHRAKDKVYDNLHGCCKYNRPE